MFARWQHIFSQRFEIFDRFSFLSKNVLPMTMIMHISILSVQHLKTEFELFGISNG